MASNNSAIIAAGVSATFHLTRLVIDLVMVASETAKVNEAKIENAKQNDASKDGDDYGKQQSRISGQRRLSTWVVNGRLSVRESIGRSYRAPDERRERGNSFFRRFSATTTTRSIPLGETTASTGNGTMPAVNGSGGGDDDNEDQTNAEEPKTGLEAAIPIISSFIHLVLFAYFLTATILTSDATQKYRPAFVNALYDAIPLGCVSVAIFIGLVMNIRDYSRKRLTSLQRGLYSISALILMMGCIVSVAFPSTDGENGNPTKVDITSLVCLIVYAILAIVEGRVCRYPKVNTKDGKKLRLNRRALLTILKPYFWPQATATSATLNRVRAISTWVFVASSKACSLTAPIFLGKASTALTRMDYADAIKYSIIYASIQFAATTLKEFQSLVYLHVAQAAFVELSEASFNHLHSLSLDWHLMKKLGEVIRSMDRGIAACDTLMKYLFLWLVPSIAECLMVTIIFATYFDYFPLAVSVFFFVYTYIFWTILITLWRKKFRKQVAKSDNDWHDRCTDSLINFETVKYFTAEEYEKKR